MPPRRSSLLSSQANRRQSRAACLPIIILPLAGILGLVTFIALLAGNNYLFLAQPYGPGATAQPGHLAAFFSPTVKFWGASIESWAAQWSLEPNLVATVMQIESCGDPQAVSPAGATGLFQVMPFHFQQGDSLQDPNTNAGRGLAFLKESLDTAHGEVRLALASYNGGTDLISLDESLWPDETIQYTYWGTAIYQDAQRGASASQVLNQWKAHNGWRLCLQASQRLGVYP